MTAEEEGRAAREAALATNPYDRRSREGRAWLTGFKGEAALNSEVFIANESGAVELGGMSYVLVKGVTRVRAGHPLLENHSQLFIPAESGVHYDVGHAAIAPGER